MNVVKQKSELETAEPELDVTLSSIDPTPAELSVLGPMERFSFQFVHRMNRGAWKRFWTFCQRTTGKTWIDLCTYNLMHVYGLENIEAADHDRPIVLVANHRSFFDMYVVSAMLFKHTTWYKELYFPVRAKFFYQSPLGLLVNLIMGWWSMYPPIFMATDHHKRLFDKYSTRRLIDLCRNGRGHLIGFHPEGTRNLNNDPYSFLPAQPGIGKLIKEAEPQVIPIFVAGLGNKLGRQVMGNWTGGPPIRIHFGPRLDLTEFHAMKNHVRTYKMIGEEVMAKIAELGEKDRAMWQEKLQKR
jgi:1-acyl-sn-glycerol-3-phosphate acyltransferase